MALVPESWLAARQHESIATKTPAVEVMEVETPASTLSSLAELLPKRLQNKAKILLHYLDGNVQVNDKQRIVYSDGSVGSHVLDMVRYFVSPFVKQRPLDAPQFETLLKALGVPDSATVRKQQPIKTPLARNWKPYK